MKTIGVDIGGTKIAAGVVDERGTILTQTRVDTDATNPAAIDAAVIEVVRELRRDHEVTAVGVAAAGFAGADRRTMLFAPNIAWRDYPLADRIEEGVDLPVVVENDANAAGWAEFIFGAARHVEDMVLLTIGTGLGGAIVVGGELVRGRWGVAAEIGHMRVVPGGQMCGCGHEGCWEQYGSGSALVRWGREAFIADPEAAAGLMERADGDPDNLTGPQITAAAQEGDWLGQRLLATLGGWLGEGMATVSSLLDPELFVIGGGVSAAGDLLLQPARDAFLRELPARGHRPEAEIVLAQMGNAAGVVGAAALATSGV